MEYEHINPSTLEVQVTRKVTLGNQVVMVPSYEYAGVDYGVAKVVGILHHSEDCGLSMLDGYEDKGTEVYANMKDFVEVELDNISDDTESPEYIEHYNALHSEPWIAYKYGDTEIYVFPLSLFISHSIPAI